jgi:feruloyl-CoA synthase
MLFNVPAGYAQLATHLEVDRRLRSSVFERLQMIFYAGAALSEDVWRRLDRVAVETCGKPVFMTSSWGLTETAPCCTSAHFHVDHTGNIGVPIPGVEVKLVPITERFELRVKGANVTPGYLRRADLTAAAFDDDGWYRTGDAARLVNPAEPKRGLFFDGRVVEDFKLSSGTFVRVTALRTRVLTTTSPVLQDLAVAGHDRDYIAVLAWPSLAGVRQLIGEAAAADLAAAAASDELRSYLRERLAMLNAAAPGSSMSVRRLMLLDEPASPDANEITDKGYINQRAVLERRADLVETLYADRPGLGVIVIE